jgi:hypothetical protein
VHRVLCGSGWGSDGYSITLRHRSADFDVAVTTDDRRRPDDFEETLVLHQWFSDRISALVTPTYPLTVVVDRSRAELVIDGKPTTFTVIGDRSVRVEAKGCSPGSVELETVDPKMYERI